MNKNVVVLGNNNRKLMIIGQGPKRLRQEYKCE